MTYVHLSVHLLDKIWSTYTISSFISISQSSVEEKEIDYLVRARDDADTKGDISSLIFQLQSSVEDKEIKDLVRVGDDADYTKGNNSFISHSQSS